MADEDITNSTDEDALENLKRSVAAALFPQRQQQSAFPVPQLGAIAPLPTPAAAQAQQPPPGTPTQTLGAMTAITRRPAAQWQQPQSPQVPSAQALSQQPQPAAAPQTLGAMTTGPMQKSYQDKLANAPAAPTGIKGVLLNLAGAFPLGRIIEQAVPGSRANYEANMPQFKAAADQESEAQNSDLARRNVQSEIDARDRDKAPNTPSNEFQLWERQNPNAPISDWMKFQTDAKNSAQKTATNDVELWQRSHPNGTYAEYQADVAAAKTTPEKLTNPFEAFAYGTPQQKQAAQSFLTFEKQVGARYEKPGEFEQRYALYQRDPDAYKAMFGDRGASQDQTNANRTLQYFRLRRGAIERDWTMDEGEKTKELAEIDAMEKPLLGAVTAAPSGKTGQPGQPDDRVTVTSPQGLSGTIPRSQLQAAQRKGYKVAQ